MQTTPHWSTTTCTRSHTTATLQHTYIVWPCTHVQPLCCCQLQHTILAVHQCPHGDPSWIRFLPHIVLGYSLAYHGQLTILRSRHTHFVLKQLSTQVCIEVCLILNIKVICACWTPIHVGCNLSVQSTGVRESTRVP